MTRRRSGRPIALPLILFGLHAASACPPVAVAGPPAPLADASPPLDPEDQLTRLLARLNHYRDGLERSARRLSLDEALRRGLQANPALRMAWEAVLEAEASAVAIQREWWPSITVGSDDPGILGWTTTITRERVRTASGLSRNETIRGGQSSLPNLSLAWSFFEPGRASRGNAARSEVAARRFLFNVDARDLILRIQTGYITLQEQAELEHDYRTLYELVSSLVAAGLPPGGERSRLDQLRTEQLALLVLRIRTHEKVILAADALAQALALPPGELAMPADPLESSGSWDIPLGATIEQAQRLREEIQANLATAGGDAWSARARRRGYLPTLSLAGQLSGTTETNSGGSLIGAFQASNSLTREIQSQVGIGFDWTVFDGGILDSQAELLRSRSRQALAQADLDRLEITRQVRDNHAALLASQIILGVSAEQVRSARSSLEAASRDYRRGRSEATRVVQAIASFRDAAESYRAAVRKHNVSIAGLQRHSAIWPEGTRSLLSATFPELATPPRPVPPP